MGRLHDEMTDLEIKRNMRFPYSYGMCGSCSTRLPVRKRWFWGSGTELWLCKECEKQFKTTLNFLPGRHR